MSLFSRKFGSLFSKGFGSSNRTLVPMPVEVPPTPTVRRFAANPIITPSMLPGH